MKIITFTALFDIMIKGEKNRGCTYRHTSEGEQYNTEQKNISWWEDGFVMTTVDILIKLNNCYYDK